MEKIVGHKTFINPDGTFRHEPLGESEALACAPMHVPDPKARRDSMIAATALAHGLTLVTRNEKDFLRTGVPLLNPWGFLSFQ